jgi:hypothetical protein
MISPRPSPGQAGAPKASPYAKRLRRDRSGDRAMSHSEFLTVLLFGGIAVCVFLYRRKNKGTPGAVPFIFVRPIAPPSNVLRNIIVLAVVVGLGWFFWYVMGTRCNGGC